MEIILKPELEIFIKEKVATGQYQSINEAINEGIKLLMFQDDIYQGKKEQLRQEIMIGEEASSRGEVIDSEEVFSQLQQKLNQLKKASNE